MIYGQTYRAMSSCAECKFFIKDKIGNGQGIGQCKQYNEYKEKRPSIHSLHAARINLGNRWDSELFWPSGGRECIKYEKAD